ncbi:MAG: Mobile element protein, partial [uncultured Gemmatimonadaceae bacterium]
APRRHARQHPRRASAADRAQAAGRLPRRGLRHHVGVPPARRRRLHAARARAARGRTRTPAGHTRTSLGRRAHTQLDEPLPRAPRALGEADGQLRGFAAPRLCLHRVRPRRPTGI